MSDFSPEQKRYLEGLAVGLATVRHAPGANPAAPSASGPERIHDEARERVRAAGGKLVAEEEAKAKRLPLDLWDELRRHAQEGRFPKGTDVFLWKFHGLFYVAPAQDSFMCRLRIPGGQLDAHQLEGIADMAERYAGGYAHVTTRANLQLREIGAAAVPDLLMAIAELGLTSRGSGADNIRNVTGSPTAGIDAQELVDTQPLCRALHHHILNHRELYGLPRKFNIAFDGGGRVAALDETNDIGFFAVRVPEARAVPAGVYFRMRLGGITGHLDFARDEGVLLRADECVAVADAVLRVFIDEGDRTNRQKARMKYVLDRLGHEAFLAKVETRLGRTLTRFAAADCEPRPPVAREGHIGFHRQKQPERWYAGVVLPVGKLTAEQLRGLADIARRHGGNVRLTVWQNLLVTGIPTVAIGQTKAAIEALGLHWRASPVRAGLVACTGNRGCRFSASDTKAHALQIAAHVEDHVAMDAPINIHLTGCHHSCAQHYIGDVGLLAARVDAGGDDTIEGYHVYVGGGYGEAAALAREIARDVPASDAPALVARLLRAYLEGRHGPDEGFRAFADRHDVEALHGMLRSPAPATA